MTSRDFGFTTLRSAVAYRRNNTLVPPNNVYVTSTNGAAVFSDTLTISTINVSTINGGGGGGGVTAVNAGTNISIPDPLVPVVSVNINSTLNMNGYGIINCNLMNNTIANGNITISAIEELNMSSNDLLTLLSNVVNVTATGDNINLRAGSGISMVSLGGDITVDSDASLNLLTPDGNITISTGSGAGRYVTIGTDLLTLSSMGDINITTGTNITVNGSTLINGTIKVASTFYDNNISSGTAGQVLTAGTGGQVIWSTISGGGGWVSTATSPLNMSTYQINNISSASSATDVPQVNNVQSAVNRFAAGTNGWAITPADQFTIYQNSFGGASSTLVTYGSIYNGTIYQGTTTHILPPSKFTINFRCPVATSTTPFGPETNWFINVPYYIRCELLSYNTGTGIVLAWLDTQTVTGWVYNTGPPNNIPYLSFNVTLCSNTSVPIDTAGPSAIGLNFTLASVNATGTYAFNPSANGYTYQDCAGIEVSVTTLAGTTGSGF